MKVRDEIESHIALLSAQIERGHVQIEADRANSEPSGMSAGTEKISRVDWASADTSSESKDPKLVVTHAADHIPTARFFY